MVLECIHWVVLMYMCVHWVVLVHWVMCVHCIGGVGVRPGVDVHVRPQGGECWCASTGWCASTAWVVLVCFHYMVFGVDAKGVHVCLLNGTGVVLDSV